MKELIITSSNLKRETIILLSCIFAGELVNLYAVLHYSRPASELVSQIGYAIVIGIIFYVIMWIIRIIVLLIRLIIRK